MLNIDKITENVAGKYSSKGYQIDPMTIIFIIGILVDVVKMVIACYDKSNYSNAVKKINNPSILDKIILSRRINILAKQDEKFSHIDCNHLRECLLDINLTEEEFTNIVLEVKNKG